MRGSSPRSVTYSYNTSGQLEKVDDPIGGVGHQTSFTYDTGVASGWLLRTIQYPTGGSARYEYDSVTKTYSPDTYAKYRIRSCTRKSGSTSEVPGDTKVTYDYTMVGVVNAGTESEIDYWFRVATATVETWDKPSAPVRKKKETFQIENSDEAVVMAHDTFAVAPTEQHVRKVAYEYYDNKALKKTTETRYGTGTHTVTRSWVYDKWGNVTQETDPLGHVRLAAFANGDGNGVDSKPWTSADYYTYNTGSAISPDIHDRKIGVRYYQDEAKTVLIESYYQYDAKGNLTETKSWVKDPNNPGGAKWEKTAFAYTISVGGQTYGPTKVIRGAHLTVDKQLVAESSFERLIFPSSHWAVVDRVMDGRTPQLNAVVSSSNSYSSSIDTKDFYLDPQAPASKTDGNGHTVEFQYDLLGRPVSTIYPRRAGDAGHLAAQAQYNTQDSQGRLEPSLVTWYSTWNPISKQFEHPRQYRRYVFDGFGRQLAAFTYKLLSDYPNSPESERAVTYNWLGLADSDTLTGYSGGAVAGTPYTFTYEYDVLGRLTKVTNPDGTVRTLSYDDSNNGMTVKTVADERGGVKEYYYDAIGRLAEIHEYERLSTTGKPMLGDPAIVTKYVFDAANNLVSMTNAKSVETRYQYDTLNRLVSTTTGGKTSFATYDDYGRLSTRTDFTGATTSYDFDQLDRLVKVREQQEASQPLLRKSFDYDRTGNLVRASNASAETWWTFDELNHATAEETTIAGRTFSTTFTFDEEGFMRGVTSPSNRTAGYDYDEAGRLGLIYRGSTSLASIEYYPQGPSKSIAFGNGVVTSYDLDPTRLRVKGIVTQGPSGQSLLNLQYRFEADGNIGSINYDKFEYDGLGRLKWSVIY